MSQFSNHPSYGYEGRHLYAAQSQYLSDADRRFDKFDRSSDVTRHPGSSRDLDDLGYAANVRHVPDFWMPCEDWTLD